MFLKKILCCLSLLLACFCVSALAQSESVIMPTDIKVIEREAFYGDISIEEVRIPESTKTIESLAFANCENLSEFFCYSRDVSVADDAFLNCGNVRIICYTGSTIEAYAKEKGFEIGYLDRFEIHSNTVNNGAKGLPITWTVEEGYCDIKDGKFTYQVFRNGELVETSEEMTSKKYVHTPSDGGDYEIQITMKNDQNEITMRSDKIAVSEKLYLGLFEQDNKAETADPVEWIILAADEEKAFVLSKYILKTDSYFNPSWIKYKYCNWAGSIITTYRSSNNWYPSASTMRFKTINGVVMVPKKDGTYISNDDLTKFYHARSWCNDTFYNGAFTDDEKARILLTRNKNEENPSHSNIDGGPDTYDYVFFLSYNELNRYLPDINSRKTANTPVAQAQLGSGKPVYWWLRTRGGTHVNAACVFASGSSNGKVWMSGSDVGHDTLGYRPAMWITVGG